ncbi:hypothetical protein SLA2020_135350 [Shorea laevis]
MYHRLEESDRPPRSGLCKSSAGLDGKFRAVGASDVDCDCIAADGFGDLFAIDGSQSVTSTVRKLATTQADGAELGFRNP